MASFRIVLVVCLALLASAVQGQQWSVREQAVARRPDMAAVCHFWNATLFAPGEVETCGIGTLYYVDLERRVFLYADAGPRGLRQPKSQRDLQTSTMYRSLTTGDGLTKLETMRVEAIRRRDEEAVVTSGLRERAQYRSAFDAALQGDGDKIAAFETRHQGRDPDNLIAQLAPRKTELLHQAYVSAFGAAQTSDQLAAAIAKYEADDPDGLVGRARERLQLLRRLEAADLAKKQTEEKERTSRREQEIKVAAQRQLSEGATYVADLQRKYGKRLIFADGVAREIVERTVFNCHTADGRTLPMMNILLAKLQETDSPRMPLTIRIERRGQSVRFIDAWTNNGVPYAVPTWEVNEWGDLRTLRNIRVEAVLSGCYGSHGPIWTRSAAQRR